MDDDVSNGIVSNLLMVDDKLVGGRDGALIDIDVPTADEPDRVSHEQSPTLVEGETVGMNVVGE